MSPVTHLLLSWSVASSFSLDRRERTLVTLAGVLPDADGLGLLWDLARPKPDQPMELWSRYHHILGHNLAFGLILAVATLSIAKRRVTTAVAALLAFHLHLFCDYIGSRGPDGPWTIPYLLPFSDKWDGAWSGQWPLTSWQNVLITITALAFVFYRGWRDCISPLELVSARANIAFVDTLRARFPTKTIC